MAPDVNVLLAAYRQDHAHHAEARVWLTGALASCTRGGRVEILPMVAVGFLRLVTNPKIFRGAATPAQAMAFLRSLLAVPGVVMLPLGSEWSLFEKLCVDLRIAGSAVTDAWIAAAINAGGLHLVTFDAGFRRLLRPSDVTILTPDYRVREPRGRYTVHRPELRVRAGARVSP